jgi:hypothetical protein
MRESRPGPAPAKTQQTGKTYRVGLIFSTSPVSEMTGPEPVHPLAKAFLQVAYPRLYLAEPDHPHGHLGAGWLAGV